MDAAGVQSAGHYFGYTFLGVRRAQDFHHPEAADAFKIIKTAIFIKQKSFRDSRATPSLFGGQMAQRPRRFGGNPQHARIFLVQSQHIRHPFPAVENKMAPIVQTFMQKGGLLTGKADSPTAYGGRVAQHDSSRKNGAAVLPRFFANQQDVIFKQILYQEMSDHSGEARPPASSREHDVLECPGRAGSGTTAAARSRNRAADSPGTCVLTHSFVWIFRQTAADALSPAAALRLQTQRNDGFLCQKDR
jgi:hypothetical protein